MSISHDYIPQEDPREWGRHASKAFLHFSPLYAHLYTELIRDDELRALLALVDSDQPVPVMFFGVVHYLVLRDQPFPLSEFYPSLSEHPRPPHEAYPAFRDFCLRSSEELRQLLPRQRLQTNEVTRCANLLPAFSLVSRRGGDRPLAMIEIGASAGLNLFWDRYGYDYGRVSAGDLASPVQIRCTLKGDRLPPLPDSMPVVERRVGIELAPVDIFNEDATRWLYAFIWPEERERFRLLDAALRLARQSPPPLLIGDARDHLPTVLAAIPPHTTACVYHSYALLQGPTSVREEIFQLIAAHSRARDLYRVSLEIDPANWSAPRLELFIYQRGELVQHEWLANSNVHGSELEWRSP